MSPDVMGRIKRTHEGLGNVLGVILPKLIILAAVVAFCALGGWLVQFLWGLVAVDVLGAKPMAFLTGALVWTVRSIASSRVWAQLAEGDNTTDPTWWVCDSCRNKNRSILPPFIVIAFLVFFFLLLWLAA